MKKLDRIESALWSNDRIPSIKVPNTASSTVIQRMKDLVTACSGGKNLPIYDCHQDNIQPPSAPESPSSNHHIFAQMSSLILGSTLTTSQPENTSPSERQIVHTIHFPDGRWGGGDGIIKYNETLGELWTNMTPVGLSYHIGKGINFMSQDNTNDAIGDIEGCLGTVRKGIDLLSIVFFPHSSNKQEAVKQLYSTSLAAPITDTEKPEADTLPENFILPEGKDR